MKDFSAFLDVGDMRIGLKKSAPELSEDLFCLFSPSTLFHFCSSPQTPFTLHCRFSRLRFFVILWTVACQAPLSMGFSRQEYWSG